LQPGNFRLSKAKGPGRQENASFAMGRALQRNVSDPLRSSEMEPKDGSKNEAQKRFKTAAAVLKATSKYADEMTPSVNRARMLHLLLVITRAIRRLGRLCQLSRIS